MMDEAIREHYRGKRLSSREIEAMIALGDGELRRRSFIGYAAVAACAAAAAGWIVRDAARELSPAAAADEVAKNHLKGEPMDIATSDWATLGDALPRLDFAPRQPSARAIDDYALLGARHCSLDGDVAAQLKLAPTATLYQVRWRPEHRVLDGAEATRRGVRVKFWRDGDVLNALAR